MDLLFKKNQIDDMIKNQDQSITFFKPQKSSKSSRVWEQFSVVVMNGVNQEMVCCDKCKNLLVYRSRDGTKSLAKHQRSCQGSESDPDTDVINQTKLTEYYSSSKSNEIPKRIKKKVKMACTEFTALDSRAFEVVSGSGFLKMAQSIFDAGRYFNLSSHVNVKELIPSSITISRNIDNLYEEKKAELMEFCSTISNYCIICDFWTEKHTGLSYCGLALRHVTSDFKLYNFILGCTLYDLESQSANNIRTFVDTQLSLYGLNLNKTICIVTDNENKMKASFKDQCIRIGCSIHYLNKQLEHSFTSDEIDKKLVNCNEVQHLFDNVKKVVTHVRRTHRQIKLKQKLQLYSDTRFNGAFYMLNVFNKVYDDIGGVLNKNYIDYLTNVDKSLLEELCEFLFLFDQAIDQLSEEERPTIYKVVPIRRLLLDHCTVTPSDSSGLKDLKSFLGERIKSIWILQDQHLISTLLHPSMKNFDNSPNEKTKAIKLVKQELIKRTPAPIGDNIITNAAATNAPVKTDLKISSFSNNLLSRCFDQPQPKVISTCTPVKELDDYMALNVQIDENDDPLLFWKEYAKSFPTLSLIVRDLFAIPASNTIVERLFSSSKNTVTDRRTSLAAAKVNKLLFLQKNLFTLEQLHEEKLKKNSARLKRSLSISSKQNVLLNEYSDNLTPLSPIKKTKTSDDFDSSLVELEDVDDSSESNDILFEL